MASTGKQNNSSLHGSSYHLRLALSILLRAFKQHLRDKSMRFNITLEDATAGKFDDIIFRYSSSSVAAGNIFIQAKHKQAPNNFNPTSASAGHPACSTKGTPMITKESLLAEWYSKSPFSIPMYFVSFLEHYDASIARTATYMLCTNADIDRHLHQCLKENEYDDDHILSFCSDIGAKCYQFRRGTANQALDGKLRDSGVEYLAKLMALHVFKRKTICPDDTILFTAHAPLIEQLIECVTEDVTEVQTEQMFIFKEEILMAEGSTTVGKFRTTFLGEYSKLLKNNDQAIVWKDVREKKLKIAKRSSTSSTAANVSKIFNASPSSYTTIDEIIESFYSTFLIVCNSANEEDLGSKSMNLMPRWVNNKQVTFNDLQALIFDGMKSAVPVPIDQDYLKARFVDINPNESIGQLQISTKQYLESLRQLYPYIAVQADRLKESMLYQFLSSETSTGIFQYRSTMSVKQSTTVLAQTMQLLQYDCLCIDGSSYKAFEDISSVLLDTLEYICDVNHPVVKFITIIGKFNRTELKEIQKTALKYKQKVIIVSNIAESLEDDLSDDDFLVSDLTEESRRQLYNKYEEVNVLGTVTSIGKIINNHDSLCFLFKLVELCGECQLNVTNDTNKTTSYDKISSWYIPRTYVPYSEQDEPVMIGDDNKDMAYAYSDDGSEIRFEHISFVNDQTVGFIKATLSSNDTMVDPPGYGQNEDEHRKVFFLLNDAGTGKSTYFTWLAWRLALCNPMLRIVRLNALQFSTDFSRLKETDWDAISDTRAVKILYTFIHLALFVPNFTSRSTAEIDAERDEANRCASMLSFTDGKVTMNERHEDGSELSTKQQLEVRIFVEKFNNNQLVLLLDGVDEISPHYKDVVLPCFARFARFDQVRHLYVSSRPVDLKTEFEQHFPNCAMYQLKPFDRKDQMLYFHKYLLRELDGYRQCEELQQIRLLSVLFSTMTDHIDTLRTIPFFLNIALSIFLPIVRENINFQEQTMTRKLVWQSKLDRLQLLKSYIEHKIKISETEKLGTADFVLYTTAHLSRQDKLIKQIEEQHALMALYVMFDSGSVSTLLTHPEQQQAVECMLDIEEGRDTTGFITGLKDAIPQFAHRMFAEYFAACWLYKHQDRVRNNPFFRSRSFWKREEHGMRDFLDRLIVNESAQCDIHIALLNRSDDQVHRMLSENPSLALTADAVGRLPLHIAVTNKRIAMVEALAKAMPRSAINKPDELLQWTALDYAYAARCEPVMMQLLEHGAKVNVDNLVHQIAPKNVRQVLLDTEVCRDLIDKKKKPKAVARNLLKHIASKHLAKH